MSEFGLVTRGVEIRALGGLLGPIYNRVDSLRAMGGSLPGELGLRGSGAWAPGQEEAEE